MAALEALATGVPILASPVGGLPDVVIPEETGWLAGSGDVGGFTEHLRSWANMKPDSRSILSQNSHRLAQARFGAQQGLARLLSTYRAAGWTG